MARVESESNQINLEVLPTSFDVYDMSCFQGESAVFVGQGLRFGGYIPYKKTMQVFQASGAGDFVGVATAPGSVANAMFLRVVNNVGSLVSAQMPYDVPIDANSSTGFCRVLDIKLRIIDKF